MTKTILYVWTKKHQKPYKNPIFKTITFDLSKDSALTIQRILKCFDSYEIMKYRTFEI